MNSFDAAALKGRISADVVLPDDDGYGDLKDLLFHTGNPAAVVRCRDNADVAGALAFAREHGLAVSVRSGGHSPAGHSTNDGGIVVDLSPMDGVEVLDPDTRTVRIGPGARWGRVAEALAGHGLGISSGDTADVGVGGLLLGGGIGWMVRKHGLALDHLTAAEMVTADGRTVRASAEENTDLFWALRGGGGNFGVVTSFEVTAQPVRDVFFGAVSYPREEAAQVLTAWGSYVRTAPEEFTSIASVFPAFGGQPPMVLIQFCYAGDSAEAADAALAPLLDFGTVLDKQVDRVGYADVLEPVGELPPGLMPRVHSTFARECGAELVDALLAGAERFESLYVGLRGLGGAFGRVPKEDTAFWHRDSEIMVHTVVFGAAEETAAAEPEFREFLRSLAPFTQGAYGNFLSRVDEADVAAVYPPHTYARLAAVKRVYDPDNVFCRTINVQ